MGKGAKDSLAVWAFCLSAQAALSALGNIWRFPYITGQYGGAAFVLMILFFLVVLGVPLLVMEFSVGRASHRSTARSFNALEPRGSKWHWFKWFTLVGNYVLMMFYTSVCGWMVAYLFKTGIGTFDGTNDIPTVFSSMIGDPVEMAGWMLLVTLVGFAICAAGVQKGVERITKVMMAALFVLMAVLCVHSCLLEGGQEGLAFYLLPNFDNLFNNPSASFAEILYAAMSQAFFMLSVGIGGMSIFGSYIGRDNKLTGEAVRIAGMDTLVAIMAGLIIFPACFAYGVAPDAGPDLVFLTLPAVFEQMPLGQLWGTIFFLCMAFAALSTVLAVFENIICCGMELTGWSRQKSSLVNLFLIIALSLPCVLGYNVWAWDGFAIFGGAVLDLEDFLVSNLFLPLGSLVYLLFCVTRYGWGWDNYKKEVNTGDGLKVQDWMRGYLTYGLPLIVLFIFVFGLYDKFIA